MSPKVQSAQAVFGSWESQKRVATLAASKPESHSGLRKLGFYCALALIFLRFSFLSDYLTYLTGKETYVLYIFGPPALVAFLWTGGWRRTFRETGPKLWLAFVVWMAAGVPFSFWRGGAFGETVEYIKTVFILVPFTVGLTVDWAECRKLIYAIGAAAVSDVVLGLYYMRPGEERFGLTWTGSVGNPNDFAAHVLLILPALAFVALRRGARRLVRVACVAIIGLGLFQVMRTASRGALVALIVTVAFLLLRGSMKQRIAIGATAAVAMAALIALLPKDTWNRMLSFEAGTGASAEALASSDIRKHLLQESIRCTLEHPLFGVGIKQFAAYEGAGADQDPGHVGWYETHNSYTEISSEGGMPELLVYLAALIWAFRLLARIKKQASGPDKEEMATAAYAIGIGVLAYSVAVFFLNFGFAFQFVAVSALVECMWRVVRDNPAVPATEEALKVPVSRRSVAAKARGIPTQAP
jgi:O-antigen ligase